MENNRMYLVYKPSGKGVYLGKKAGTGWCDVPNNLSETITKLFKDSEQAWFSNPGASQDDFAILMEKAENCSHVITKHIRALGSSPSKNELITFISAAPTSP